MRSILLFKLIFQHVQYHLLFTSDFRADPSTRNGYLMFLWTLNRISGSIMIFSHVCLTNTEHMGHFQPFPTAEEVVQV